MSFYKLPLSYIHLELTTKCNAACPMCLRNKNGDIVNPNLELVDFDINWLENFDIPIDKLTLCGNYGDPTLYGQVHELIERWYELYNKPVIMMTNGGARSTQWWADLARIGGDKLKVVFGIDGLEDTNHLYRRNVRWDRLMENAQAFIDNGGNAIWKFIIFRHNQHQMDDARALAKQMGFRQFEQIKTNRFEEDYLPVVNKQGETIYTLQEPDFDSTGFTAKNPNRLNKNKKEFDGVIQCYAQKESSMYIAADGRAYPCCNTGYHYNGYKNNMNIEIVDVQAEQQVYSIKTHKLSELIEGDFFNTIQTRWDTNPIRKCVRTCGVTRDNLHKVESL
jgi:MoaA/NifB/PqqE/SkfB family radical SAM enzyme